MELFAITAIRRGGLRGSSVGIRRTLAATWRLDALVLFLPPIRIRHFLILFIPRRTLIFLARFVVHKTSVSRFLFRVTRVAIMRSFDTHLTWFTLLWREADTTR
jgi:hypothetical protein